MTTPSDRGVNDQTDRHHFQCGEHFFHHHRFVAIFLAHSQPPGHDRAGDFPAIWMEHGGEGCELTIQSRGRGVASEPGMALIRVCEQTMAVGSPNSVENADTHVAPELCAGGDPTCLDDQALGAQSSTRLIMPTMKTSCSRPA